MCNNIWTWVFQEVGSRYSSKKGDTVHEEAGETESRIGVLVCWQSGLPPGGVCSCHWSTRAIWVAFLSPTSPVGNKMCCPGVALVVSAEGELPAEVPSLSWKGVQAAYLSIYHER